MSMCELCIQGVCDDYFTCDYCEERKLDEEMNTSYSKGMTLCDDCYDELDE